jgi:integrase
MKGEGIYKRNNTWWLDFTHEGRRHYERLGKFISKTAAKEIAQTKRAAILKGEAGIGGKKRKDISFDDAKKHFLEWSETNRKPHSVTMHKSALKKLGETFSGKKLSEITRFSVEGYKSQRSKAAPVRCNRELQTLKSLFNRCIEWKKYEGENPVKGVKLLKESKGRLRFLSHEEEARLLANAGEPLRTIILAGIHTGLRVKSEGLSLKWGSVDMVRRTLTVQDAHAKNGESRTVPMNAVVSEAFRNLKQRSLNTAPDAPVFVNRDGKPFGSIRTVFTTARKKAGLSADVTPHVLRHTFASRLVMAGVDLRTVQELGGWKRIEMVMRYSHLSAEHRVQAVEKIAQAPIAQERAAKMA